MFARFGVVRRQLPSLFVVTLLSITSLAQTTYSIQPLQLSGATMVDARAGINKNSQVAGDWTTTSSTAYRWTSGIFTNLGLGLANGINDTGEVVGVSTLTNHATLWRSGHTIDLGTLFSGGSSIALGISPGGSVVGYDQDASGTQHAFRWTAKTGIVHLSDFGVGSSQATHMNAKGQIVGWATHPTYGPHAVIWKAGKIQLLWIPDTNFAAANSINLSGFVIGQAPLRNGTVLAYVMNPTVGGSVINLLSGFENEVATAINNPGTVIGYDYDSHGNMRPFACFNRVSVDLNTLISAADHSKWLLQVAQGINDQGQIVGYGLYQGSPAVFLLAPEAPVQNASCY